MGFDKHIMTGNLHYHLTQSSFTVVTAIGNSCRPDCKLEWSNATGHRTGAHSLPDGLGLALHCSFALHPTGVLIPALPQPALRLPVDSESHDRRPRCCLSVEVGQGWCLGLVTRGPCPFPYKEQVCGDDPPTNGDLSIQTNRCREETMALGGQGTCRTPASVHTRSAAER